MDKTKLIEGWKAINEAREKVATAEREGRELSAEEQASVDAALADGTKLIEDAGAAERKSRLEAIAEQLGATVERPKVKGSEDEDREVKTFQTKTYAKEFTHYLRTGELGDTMVKAQKEAKSQNIGTDTAGGHLVPPEYLTRLLNKLEAFTPMLGLATVVETQTAAIEVPKVDSHGVAAWTAEEAPFNESDEVFGNLTIAVHKATRLVKASEELIADSAFDVDGYLSDEMGRSLGRLLNIALTTGDGSGKPFGVIPRVDASKVHQYATGNSTSITTADELFEVKHTVAPWYRNVNSRWMLTDTTLKNISLLKGTDDHYLWNPDLTGGSPGSLLGHGVVINPDMAEQAASAKSLAFGDFSYFWVCRRPDIAVQRLNELYSATGQVGFRVFARFGADLTFTDEPIAIGQNSAT